MWGEKLEISWIQECWRRRQALGAAPPGRNPKAATCYVFLAAEIADRPTSKAGRLDPNSTWVAFSGMPRGATGWLPVNESGDPKP